jgi:hypothetical protein
MFAGAGRPHPLAPALLASPAYSRRTAARAIQGPLLAT